jgi:hypothetical protein
MEVSVQRNALVALSPEKYAGADFIESWVGPRADLDVVEKRKVSYP